MPVERPPVDENEDDDDADEEEEEEEEVPEPDEGDDTTGDIDQPMSSTIDRPQLTARTDLVIEPETSPEPSSSHIVPSPVSPIVPLSSPTPDPQIRTQASPQTYPRALAVATPSQLDRPPSAELSDDCEDRARLTDSTVKRNGESASTWERMKTTLGISRSGSASGRRSRTNSMNARDRRNNTDSSVSRDSRASLSKDKGEHAHPDTQPPSASTSMLSLPAGAQVGLHSPVPPATPNEMLIYGPNSKLHPFPGLKPSFPNMKSDAKGGKPMSPSASSPDVVSPMSLGEAPSSSSSNTATWQIEGGRERKLSHQASDSRLLPKYNGVASPPPVSAANSNTSQGDFFSIHRMPTSVNTSATGSMKLPMNREGVKKWLSAKKLFYTPTSPVTSPNGSASPPSDHRPKMGEKKGSFSDLLLNRKEIESEWEEPTRGKSPSPLSPPSTSTLGKSRREEGRLPPRGPTPVFSNPESSPDTMGSPRPDPDYGRSNGVASSSDFSALYPSPPDAVSTTTPDPHSSYDEFPNPTTESYSDSSSHRSIENLVPEPSKGAYILERLDEVLGRGTKTAMYPDDPPRKLVMSSPILQVANANTVKDRFLFLFNDILVIAKPIVQDHDALLDPMKPSPIDRKFIVKSVCQLRDLRLCSDRDEPRSKSSHGSTQLRHPVIRSFVTQFSKDPDHAVTALFAKANCRDDPVALGQLLFRTADLDRARLGDFLSRRASKVALKAFVDTFGLTALRIDKALRVFLQAINVPNKPGALEYLLDSFASRWYEANAGIVAYDKDLAIRLVRAIVQLNEVMHGAIAQEPGPTGYPRRNVTVHDFIEAFRKFDRRGLVSDELLEKIYSSVRMERLSQARSPSTSLAQPDISVTIKRPLPSRLTYRMQSEPIILRIPQPDPQLTIQLFGQDLVFDPPVLNFARSSEASFRVTGTSLGTKSIVMWRSGPHGILYSGLPLSSTVVVERAFMRNTFQLAFINHNGAKRKYMFSVDEAVMRHQWVVSIKRQIDIVVSTVTPAEASGSSSKIYKANERLAFRVLQDTLIGPDGEDTVPMSPVDEALARLNGAPSPRHVPNSSVSSSRGTTNGRFGSGWPGRKSNGASPHVRSKSRSKVYPRHGPGRFEMDLSDSSDTRTDDEQAQPDNLTPSQPQRLWSGRDLDIVCRQNSLITPMLAYLQAQTTRRDTATPSGGGS